MPEALPEVLSATGRHGGDWVLELQVPAAMAVLDGHFPELPLIPGVAQIDWAVRLARAHLGCRGRFRELRDLKFLRVIEPPARLRLTLQWEAVAGTLRFAYEHAGSDLRCASGRIGFDGDD